MAEKIFLFGARFFIFVSLVILLLIISLTSPYKGDGFGVENKFSLLAFYVSFFVFFSAFFSKILFSFRRKFWDDQDLIEAHIGVSLRQGFLLAIVLTLMIFLQSLRVLVWWDALLVVGAFFVAELYFLSR